MGLRSGVAETGAETGDVSTVVAGITVAATDGGPDVFTVGVTVEEVEIIETELEDVDRVQWDTVGLEEGNESVLVLAIACATLVTLLFGIGRTAPAL